MDWYTINNIEDLDTPALVVYPDRVRENIQRAISMVGSPARLRPHVKTHKSPAVTRLMLEAGIRQFKCATIAEAEMLATEGAPDVLLAYQPIGPKIARLAALIRQFPATEFSCLIDNPYAATAMARVFNAAGLVVPVYLDLNVGMDRTGINPGPDAMAFYKLALQLDGINPVGLHAYDGHIRDADPEQRKQKCDSAFAGVTRLRAAIAGDSASTTGSPSTTGGSFAASSTQGASWSPDQPLKIIAGGSPTFPIHARRAAEIQCSPGTFVYWDEGYGDQFKDESFLPAALVITRVISLRGDTRLCLDLGHKSIGSENDLNRRVLFLNGGSLRPVGQSEEHLVVEAGAGHGHLIGDVFYGVPFHICPTVALYERALTIEEGRHTGDWKNAARDRKLTI
jgi:D-serine deaminase-like pyridoxal phosphate-dependent protein